VAKYVLGRIGRALITMFIVLSIVFMLMRLLPVETYFGGRSDTMSDAVKEQILNSLGLLDPMPKQLVRFWGELLRGDLGKSIVYRKGVPNTEIIIPKAVYSFRFGIASLAISLVVGLCMGVLMATYKGKHIDKLGNTYVLLINALPAAVYYLFIQLYITDLFNIPMLVDMKKPVTWILPTISMSLGGIASNAMWMRRYMVDQLNQDYIRLALAKGLSSRQVAFRHILRNAFIPMSQSLPTSLLFTISGSLYIESLYSIPGMGGLLITAIQRQDNTLVQAMVLLYSALSVTGMLLGDLAMMVCDPRIKLVKEGGVR
jgi:oligopeptide transport system permease protein